MESRKKDRTWSRRARRIKSRNRRGILLGVLIACAAFVFIGSRISERRQNSGTGSAFLAVADAVKRGMGSAFQNLPDAMRQSFGNGAGLQSGSLADTEEVKNTNEMQADTACEASTETEKMESGSEWDRTDPEVEEAAAMKQNYQNILNLSAGELAAEGLIEKELADRLFFAKGIDDEIFARINGKSYTPNEHIQLSELSYLRMLCYGVDGNTYVGEMIVNKQIESEILAIFLELYENRYPIERMELVDNYNADDEASMEDNNTSAFNYRTISGSNKLSNHSYGMAVDLNPKYNPYVKTASDGSISCQPASGLEYADRSRESEYKIDENDLAYQLFTQAGFTWGGSWNSVKDYQHFEKEN